MFGNILIWFVIIPVLMMAGLGLCRNSGMKAIRAVMVVGSTALLALAIWLCVDFLSLRAAGNDAEMLYTGSWMWYSPLNIHLAVGVDGISVLMLMLSAIIVFAGTFASWKISPLPKNFFLWFALLSTGVFGFFISIDMFTMFMFYEVALIPMYLLIGVWGTGRKEYSAMKLTLMLMGGSAFLMLGLLGIYWHSAPAGANSHGTSLRLPATTPSIRPGRVCSSSSHSWASVCSEPCSPSTHGVLMVTLARRPPYLCFMPVCS